MIGKPSLSVTARAALYYELVLGEQSSTLGNGLRRQQRKMGVSSRSGSEPCGTSSGPRLACGSGSMISDMPLRRRGEDHSYRSWSVGPSACRLQPPSRRPRAGLVLEQFELES